MKVNDILMPITDINQLDFNKMYSYSDYLLWQFNERIELIKGKIFKMSPAPSEIHQKISFKITRQLAEFLDGKPCSIYYAPFDVRLPFINERGEEEKEIYNVVQPDIVIICDQNKIDKKGCLGAPDVVFEILSKSSRKKDLYEKYDLYEEAGVKEYWIVNPFDQTIQVNVLGTEGKYIPGRLLTNGNTAISQTLPGIEIELNDLFPNIVSEPEETYGENVRRL